MSALVAAVGLLAACGNDAALVGPNAVKAADSPTPGTQVLASALGRTTRLSRSLTTSKLIDSTGGEIRLDETGLIVQIPAGALSRPTVITATAIAGGSFAYDFGPHGTTFARPVVMQQELERGRLGLLPSSTKLEVAYFASPSQMDASKNEVLVDEFLPAEADARANRVRWEVTHFSGYVVSTGRGGRNWGGWNNSDRGQDDRNDLSSAAQND